MILQLKAIAAAIVIINSLTLTPIQQVNTITPENITNYEVSRGELTKRESIHYTMNLLTPSNLSVNDLEICLQGNLKGLGHHFIWAEKETGVNAIFLASVAALESGWGESDMAVYKNNLFGYGNMKFSSKEDCIMFVANKFKADYLTEGGKYFSGFTVKDVNVRYCELASWGDKVYSIMKDMEELICLNKTS